MDKAGEKMTTTYDQALKNIYFEKQEGSLCGQHALNNALQGNVFNAVDLSDIARKLDDLEREQMALGGVHTQEYKDYLKKPSANYDDSGYFSIQVLTQALKNLNLELISLNSEDPRAKVANSLPQDERLFIFHSDDHWFSIRRFGAQWINLNSALKKPDLINKNHFDQLLKSMQLDGYTIFVVFGTLPECQSDKLWSKLKLGPDGNYVTESAVFEGQGNRLGAQVSITEDDMIQEGIRMSLGETQASILRSRREAFLAKLNQGGTESDNKK